jgi:hypothetical protein
MALDYLAYQQNVRSPLEMAMAGYQTGVNLRQQREKEAAAEQQKLQTAQMQADLALLASNPNPTVNDYTNLMLKYPTMAENLKAPLAQLTEQQSSAKRAEALNIFAALDAGQTEIAESLLQRQLEAAQNTGRQADVDSANALLQLVRTNPNAAKTSAGLFLASSMGVDKFGETWTKLQSEQRERQLLPGQLEKQAADLGLTQQQTKEALARTDKLGAETQKLALELKAMENGVVDPQKTFNMENTLRGDYQKRTTSLSEGTRNLDIIQQSAGDKTGAGDIALITSFMKMLDPGSVVRETEFASAQNTAGLVGSLESWLKRLNSGELLKDEQRKTFANLAKKYMQAAEREDKRVRDDLGFVIKSYNLNPENIFGSRAGVGAPEDETEQKPAASAPGYMKYTTQGGAQ